jgi:hypothetical protein
MNKAADVAGQRRGLTSCLRERLQYTLQVLAMGRQLTDALGRGRNLSFRSGQQRLRGLIAIFEGFGADQERRANPRVLEPPLETLFLRLRRGDRAEDGALD